MSGRDPDEALLDGVSVEQMAAELGIHELTYEACMVELFGRPPDMPAPPAPPKGRPVGRVTQMGPGRRNTPNPKPNTKEK